MWILLFFEFFLEHHLKPLASIWQAMYPHYTQMFYVNIMSTFGVFSSTFQCMVYPSLLSHISSSKSLVSFSSETLLYPWFLIFRPSKCGAVAAWFTIFLFIFLWLTCLANIASGYLILSVIFSILPIIALKLGGWDYAFSFHPHWEGYWYASIYSRCHGQIYF